MGEEMNLENLSQWVFKAIYYPISMVLGVCCALVLVYLVKETEWNAPFRWLCLINVIAIIADVFVKKP